MAASISIDSEMALTLINSDTSSPGTKIIACLALASILAGRQESEVSQIGFIESLGTINAMWKHLGGALYRIQDRALDEAEA